MSKKELAIKQAEIVRRVNMSNALTRSAQNLTLAEKRLVMLAISKIDSTQPATPQNMIVTVTAEEFSRQFDVSMDTAYDELQSAGKQMFKRYISFHWDAGANLAQMHWVGRATYKDKEGKIELAFWHELAPQLFELSGLFTSYRLSRVSALRSFYTWRLFDLLMQFRKTGWLKIPIADFCHAVEAPERYRSDSGQLRRSVIEPAVKEIREKDGLDLTWEAIKAGRKVVMLEFKFPKELGTQDEAAEITIEPPKALTAPKPRGRPKKAATPITNTPNAITREEIERHARPGESYEQVAQRLREAQKS